MERRTAPELWRDAVRDAPPEPAYLEETEDDWRPVSWDEAAERVEALAHGLLARGVRHGDRIAVLSRTRLEWILLDWAVMSIGAVVVGLYPTSSAKECEYILGHCEAVLAFARYPERFPAGRQNAYAPRSAEKRRRQAGHRLNDMLAVVEQQQHPVVSKGSDKGDKRIFGEYLQTQHGRNRARHQAGVAEGGQVDKPDAVFVAGDHALGDGEGDRGLADTSGSDDRHQALARKSRDERRHRFLAADHPSYSERQIVRRRRRDCRRQRGS